MPRNTSHVSKRVDVGRPNTSAAWRHSCVLTQLCRPCSLLLERAAPHRCVCVRARARMCVCVCARARACKARAQGACCPHCRHGPHRCGGVVAFVMWAVTLPLAGPATTVVSPVRLAAAKLARASAPLLVAAPVHRRFADRATASCASVGRSVANGSKHSTQAPPCCPRQRRYGHLSPNRQRAALCHTSFRTPTMLPAEA